MSQGPLLFAEDIAAMRNVSLRTAERWLQRVEAEYGAVIVGRLDGRASRARRYTTEAAMQTLGPRWSRIDESLRDRLSALEADRRTLAARVSHLEEQVRSLLRAAGVDARPRLAVAS